jgi:hypothetical protein
MEQMPAEVVTILQARCAGCHTYGQADPSGWGSVLDLARMVDSEIVVPGNPGASRLIDRVVVRGDMPPRGERLSAAEVEKLRSWITNLKRPTKAPRTDEDILDLIANDLLKLRGLSADFRYFSLAHFVDQGRSAQELKVAKWTLNFIVNSLSRRGQIVPLVPIDADNSVYRIRLVDLGWDEDLWDEVTSFYPYCLKSDAAAHEALYEQLGTEAPWVRGDWFMDTATKAPLYDQLTDLPNTLNQLAARLGIDIEDNINHPGKAEPDQLVRIAMRRSGVALQNRMLERHLGNAGQYLWISYDFDSSVGRQDLFANPLGPRAIDEQNFVHTFEHAGGEVIFTMPNGLQGYMVVNAAGQKLNAVPLNIARDPRRRDAVVENGLSCFNCHGNVGLIRSRATDEMSKYLDTHVADFLRREFNEIKVLYPKVLAPDVINLDGLRYRASADTTEGGGPPRGASEYTEFVTLIGQYESNIGFRGAAAEFNEEPEVFRERVLANDFKNRTLPRNPTDPLISRNDFICAFRDLAPLIRPQRFCNGTFNADAVQELCQ